jgi:hypothetical protein
LKFQIRDLKFMEEQADLESITLSENPKFRAIIERAREEARRGLGRPIEDVRRELGLPDPPPMNRTPPEDRPRR